MSLRRSFFLFTAAFVLLFARGPALNAAEPARPNIVLIMADDLGQECLGCYGNTSYKTPHLDALAATGIRFSHCYCTPLCSPSRVQIMTGRYGFRTGWTNLIGGPKEFLDPQKEKTFGHFLQAAGYKTASAGKWQLCDFDLHPDHLTKCGFDEHCMWTWMYKGQQRSRSWDPFVWQNGKLCEDTKGKYGPDLYCEFLIDFITRNKDRSFFVYYPMALVHSPFEATPDSKGGGAGQKGDNQRYANMVAYMDKLVGKIVATLDKHHLREKTLILFTGDNGTPRGITAMIGSTTVPGGKGTMTDQGSHVPLIANWKGTTPAGKVLNDLVDFSDMVPTFCALTGAELPKGVTIDGVSFAPQLRGQAGKPREWVFSQLGKNRYARDQRWKLHGDGKLFDMEKDPFEKNDLSAGTDPGAQAAQKRLQAVLDQLRK
jgi:arylsulfatase A